MKSNSAAPYSEVVKLITAFCVEHGTDMLRESAHGIADPENHPGLPGLCLSAAERRKIPGFQDNWKPAYSSEIGEIRLAPDEFGNTVEVLDLLGDKDVELTEELNRLLRDLQEYYAQHPAKT